MTCLEIFLHGNLNQMKSNHFNWSYLFEDSSVDSFLKEERHWGQGQGPDNPGRQAWLNRVKALSRPAIIGELGPGIGVDYGLLQDSGLLSGITYHALDVTPEFCVHLAKTYPDLKVTNINGYDIPFTDCYFDVFYMRHVLEHQENYRWQLREIFRVTRNEIFINFFLPLTESPADNIKFDNIFYHNQYSKTLFEKFCSKYGWVINSDTTNTTIIDDVEYSDEIVVLYKV